MMVYTTTQLVASTLRRKVQFSGSSGSSLGLGTRMMSVCPWPSACLETPFPPVSIKRTVPGGRTSSACIGRRLSWADMARGGWCAT